MKDTQFANVKSPKYLEGPHITYDRSTNSSRMQHRISSNSVLLCPSLLLLLLLCCILLLLVDLL